MLQSIKTGWCLPFVFLEFYNSISIMQPPTWLSTTVTTLSDLQRHVQYLFANDAVIINPLRLKWNSGGGIDKSLGDWNGRLLDICWMRCSASMIHPPVFLCIVVNETGWLVLVGNSPEAKMPCIGDSPHVQVLQSWFGKLNCFHPDGFNVFHSPGASANEDITLLGKLMNV